jgi:hypothetical protein
MGLHEAKDIESRFTRYVEGDFAARASSTKAFTIRLSEGMRRETLPPRRRWCEHLPSPACESHGLPCEARY